MFKYCAISKLCFVTFASFHVKAMTTMMKGIVVKQSGPCENMMMGDVPVPTLKNQDILLKIHYSAVNRADILQRRGFYPPPPGESEILGLEASGVIVDIGSEVNGLKIGDQVMALLPGGGYAQYASVNHKHVIHLPENLSLREAAALPEAWLTAYQLLHKVGNISKTDTVLVHAAASGVGTAILQLLRLHGIRAIATTGSQEKVDFCLKLGAELAVNYKDEDFVEAVLKLTNDQGVSMIVDCVGGQYWEQNLRAISKDSQWILYGLLGGGQINGAFLSGLLAKRVHLLSSTLRTRSDEYKADLIRDFSLDIMPYFSHEKCSRKSSACLTAVIDKEFTLEDVPAAHKYVEENRNLGKVLLRVDSTQNEEL